jgi:hypothetical protein
MECWIEPAGGGRDAKGFPTAALKAKALPFAMLARDVYSYNTGREERPGTPIYNWVELMASPQERKEFISFEKLRFVLARFFGFNAMLYRIGSDTDLNLVLAFEGTHGRIRGPRDFSKFLQDMVLTNIPTTMSAANVLENLSPFGIFGKLLNPTKAPSSQYEMAEILVRVAIDRFNSGIVLTGHSLGGGLAQYASMKTGLRAITFNSAGVGFEPFASESAGKIAHFKTVGGIVNPIVTDFSDPFSRHFGSEYVIGSGGHGMDDVIRLLRQPSSVPVRPSR